MRLADVIALESNQQRRPTIRAAALGVIVGSASVILLGLSGWFITASALAGAASAAVATSFNYMLPSAAIRLLAIARTAARYGEAVFSHDAGLHIGAKLRPALFAAIAAAPIRQALALSRGRALSMVVDDVATVETALVRRSARWSAAGALLGGAALLGLAGWVAILGVGAVALLVLVASEQITRAARPLEEARDAALADLRIATDAILAAAAEVRCYRPDEVTRWIEEPDRTLAAAQRRLHEAGSRLQLVQAAALTVSAGLAFGLSPHEAPAVAALAALAAAMTLDGLSPLLRELTERNRARSAAARLDTHLQGCSDTRPINGIATMATLELLGRGLAAGERAWLCGQSGSGKTSLLERLLALRPPIAGQARIDGIDIAFLPPEQLRPLFAWQPQDASALSGTVRDNLQVARPGACDRALWQALRDAALDDVVHALPNGLDSWIGEDGARFSGGERRRLSLARAFVSDALWLLLDEPLEGLDAPTARLILDRLDRRLARTRQGLIVVSHRPLPGLTGLSRIDLSAADAPNMHQTARA